MRQIDEQRQKHNLPIQPTSFVGRTTEVAEITHFLADPTCRLLTLVGPGGIGKTRLAIQVGTETLAQFADGVVFVPLQPVRSTDFLVPAIADALQFTLRGQEDPARQLFNYVHGKEYLLILDNFEHLLAVGVDLIAGLLAACPTIKLLITSQEVLNLQEEWLYHVPGMSLASDLSPGPQGGGAIQLFERRARRVRRDFLLADEKAEVLRICRLVEGSPLAIELAASWTKTLACKAIADEIEQNINFLTSNLRNVPERQRSMRAVFDYSWQLLSPEERNAFMRLSVFRGGFQREAAARVAGAALHTLSLLVDKSLLRLNADGRYQIHEVLRQCAAEQLAQFDENVTRFYDLHCAYYADFLRQRWPHLAGGRQRETMAEIRAELENVRLAWQWAVELAKVEEIDKAAQTLDGFYQFQSRFVEAAAAFEQAVNSLAAQEATPEIELALARQLIFLSWYCIRLGDFQKAQNLIEKSQALYQAHHFIHSPGLGTDPLGPLSILALVRGDYTTAMELGERSRQINESKNDLQNLAFAHYILAGAYSGRGQYEQARHHVRQAYELSHTSEDRWFMAYCLIEWGNIARAMAAYDEAKQHFQASYALRKEFDDPEGVAVALHHLGKIAVIQKDYAGARQLYQQSVTIYRQINDRGGLAASLGGLGVVAGLEGDGLSAQQHFWEALQMAVDIQFVPLTLSILIDIAELLGRTGRVEPGIELLAFIHQHPAVNQETKERAKQCLARYQAELTPDLFVEATQRGATCELAAVVATTEAEFVTSAAEFAAQAAIETSPGAGAGEKLSTPAGAAVLVEPLTSRELEVLQYMATGLTNQQIAKDLILSVGTVKWYTGQIYGKLNVGNRTQAVARARELELLV